MKMIEGIKSFLERIDSFRDEVLFVFIKPYWPRKFTPNHLTFIRIVISVILFVSLFYYKYDSGWLIISLFFIGILTDMLDGSVARGLDKITPLGTMLDPLADRMIIVPIAVYSIFNSHAWLLLTLIGLELVNSLISLLAHIKGVFGPSNIFGKIKMFLQSIVFLGILIFWPNPPHMAFIYILWISGILLIGSIYAKIVEIIQYQK